MTDRLRVVARLRERIHHGVKLGQRRSREVMKPLRAKCKLEGLRSGEVAEPGLRRTPGTRVNSKGFRGFESPPLRHRVPISENTWLESLNSPRQRALLHVSSSGENHLPAGDAQFAAKISVGK
jgi:hypothetical protein